MGNSSSLSAHSSIPNDPSYLDDHVATVDSNLLIFGLEDFGSPPKKFELWGRRYLDCVKLSDSLLALSCYNNNIGDEPIADSGKHGILLVSLDVCNPSQEPKFKIVHHIVPHDKSVLRMVRVVLSEERFLLSCSNDKTIKLWEPSGLPRYEWEPTRETSNSVPSCVLNHDGWVCSAAQFGKTPYVLFGGEDNREEARVAVSLGDVSTSTVLRTWSRGETQLHQIWAMLSVPEMPSCVVAGGSCDGITAFDLRCPEVVLRQDLVRSRVSGWVQAMAQVVDHGPSVLCACNGGNFSVFDFRMAGAVEVPNRLPSISTGQSGTSWAGLCRLPGSRFVVAFSTGSLGTSLLSYDGTAIKALQTVSNQANGVCWLGEEFENYDGKRLAEEEAERIMYLIEFELVLTLIAVPLVLVGRELFTLSWCCE